VSVQGDLTVEAGAKLTGGVRANRVTIAAASLRVPTLLFSGGLSPYLTQRIVQRLGAIMDGAEIQHLPAAGHMLPLTHASSINPAIVRHIARADELAGVPLAGEPAPAEAVSMAEE
jgi:pimeloyl-ACP methyl ester carboxylesterase